MSQDLALVTKDRELFLKTQGIKAEGLIINDTQYRSYFNHVLKLLEKADKLALKKQTNKLDKVQKEIIKLSAELLEYEKFRSVYK